jgi:isopenicillin N synthase-like dioxygenase
MGQCFTILWQQPGIRALQVLNPDKQWVNAPPVPGSLVIKYFLFLGSYFRTLTMSPLSQQPR